VVNLEVGTDILAGGTSHHPVRDLASNVVVKKRQRIDRWALTVSFPEPYEPYVLNDGELANGASALHETYLSLSKALPQISYYTDMLKVFMSDKPGQQFSQTESITGSQSR